jgi:parallel beta-helix repeat protein
MSRRAAGTARRLRFEGLESRLALATLYVSPLGSDAGDGSEGAPWKTLQKAADSVQAGDTVLVRPGNYAGFYLETDGAAGSPITFRADPNVVINVRNPVTADGINLEGADYVTIEGFTVSGMPRAGIRSVTNHHVTIKNNRTDLNGVWGIFTGFSEDLLIEGNVASRSVQEHGIYVSNSADRPTIRGNTSWGNYANGIHMNGDVSMGGDGIISGALVENNIVFDNGRAGGSGINADGVQDSVFQNNLLYGNHASGISLYRIDGGGGSSGNLVANNTIVGASDSRWALNITDGSTGNTVVNNILYTYHSYRGSITISSDSLAGFTSDYNIVMNRFTTDDGNTVKSLDQWRSATGQDTHSIIATPSQLFVGGSDYHLSATSPAIDAGTSLRAPSRDLEGNARPSGSGYDIGAYERPVLTVNRAPVAANDSASTTQGVQVDINVLANDSDPDGDVISVGSFSQPAQGTVVLLADGRLRYTPNSGYSGADSFTYAASDGSLASNVATVSIDVQSAPTVPTIVAFDVQHGAEQRSYIRHLDLVFASDAGLSQIISGGRLRLTRFGLDGSGSGANINLADRLQTAGAQISIDFGAGGIGGNPNSTAGNGYYRLALDADGNGTFETTRHFYRLLGDANGDCVVNSLDRQAVDAAFGQSGINLNADLNGDGVVNRRDRRLVDGQLGRRVASGLPQDE